MIYTFYIKGDKTYNAGIPSNNLIIVVLVYAYLLTFVIAYEQSEVL